MESGELEGTLDEMEAAGKSRPESSTQINKVKQAAKTCNVDACPEAAASHALGFIRYGRDGGNHMSDRLPD